MFASNDVASAAPVLGVSLDPTHHRLRLELKGPLDRRVRLESSPDLANWTYVGTYGSADPPPWFDLPAGPGGANGFYRAAFE